MFCIKSNKKVYNQMKWEEFFILCKQFRIFTIGNTNSYINYEKTKSNFGSWCGAMHIAKCATPQDKDHRQWRYRNVQGYCSKGERYA